MITRILAGPPLGLTIALLPAAALDGLPWQAWLLAALVGLALTLAADAPEAAPEAAPGPEAP